jgi:predicted nucleic acid-binding protein
MAHQRRNRREENLGNPNLLFADTGFWIALLEQRDQYADQAFMWKAWLTDRRRLLTTDFVLWEVLNALAVPSTRQDAAEVYRQCRAGLGVDLIRLDSHQIDRAFVLYAARMDKAWSLTDCHFFIVMRERGLTDALTADRHFVQAGFRALLLEEPPSVS